MDTDKSEKLKGFLDEDESVVVWHQPKESSSFFHTANELQEMMDWTEAVKEWLKETRNAIKELLDEGNSIVKKVVEFARDERLTIEMYQVASNRDNKIRGVVFSFHGADKVGYGCVEGVVGASTTISRAILQLAKCISGATLRISKTGEEDREIKVPDLFAESEIPEK